MLHLVHEIAVECFNLFIAPVAFNTAMLWYVSADATMYGLHSCG